MADDDHQVLIDVIEIAPDGTTHTYWSTHCRHGNHEACSASELSGRVTRFAGNRGNWAGAIQRQPAQCKTCAAPCVCGCHEGGTEWAPGAGWARLKREAPHLIPEITEEDQRRADEIIAAGALSDAVRYFKASIAYIDQCTAPYRGMPYTGTVQEEINSRPLVHRRHLAVLLRTLGVDVPDLEAQK